MAKTTTITMADALLSVATYNCRGTAPDRLCFIQRLMQTTDILFVQEHWLYDWELSKLCASVPNVMVMGRSGMEPDRTCLGRPFGGCAMLYKSSLKCSFLPIDTSSRRMFACIASFNEHQKYLLVCVYMPHDSRDRFSSVMYREVLADIESILEMHPGVDYVMIGGDLNTDMNRAESERPSLLRDFCERLGLHICFSSDVDYTYKNDATSARSVIDHFIVSDNLSDLISEYSVTHDGDNLSDHDPIRMAIYAPVEQSAELRNEQQLHRLAWHRATLGDKEAYQGCLRDLLANIRVPYEVLNCDSYVCACIEHQAMLDRYYDDLTQAISSASRACIPKRRRKQVAGWTTHVKSHQTDAIFWNSIWKSCGRPREGWVAEIRRKTRAQYKRTSQWVLRNQEKLSAERMAEALSENRARDMWTEIKKVKGGSRLGPNQVDEAEGPDAVCDLFKQKYEALYSSVPFEGHEMDVFLDVLSTEVESRCASGSCEGHFSVTVDEVKYAVSRLKGGKSDADVELSSDNFIFACDELLVHLSFLFNMMISRCSAPSGMLKSILVPIPKNRKKGLSDSNNFRSIALSSVIGKILDHVVLAKYAEVLMTSELQFGFKAQHSTTQCTFVLNEVVSYYNDRDTPVFVTLLDATKAFDRVHYVKVFRLLHRRNMCPVLLMLLASMYTAQSLAVRWQGVTSVEFPCINGIKQGGVMSPVLFCVYFDELIQRLSAAGVGCHVGHRFVGALSYADDVTLLSPTFDATCQMLQVCEEFADEYDVIFNCAKSQVLLMECRGRRLRVRPVVRLNGNVIEYVDGTLHLGTCVGKNSHESNVN